jgi:hypothetical protein
VRASPVPTLGMITTRFKELRKRRGLLITLILVNIFLPTLFLVIRLLAHAFAPKSYGPAGGYDIFTNLVAGVMYVFGFIAAAALGCTAGSIDLTEGVFRHLVVTGRSRLALYFARIPAGLAIVWPLVAVGFTIVCAVCIFAAPTTLKYQGTTVPAGLSLSGFENWATEHPTLAICGLPYNGPEIQYPCGNGPGTKVSTGPGGPPAPSPGAVRALAIQIAKQNYPFYKSTFLYPSNSLMIKAGLWIELEATIGFVVGLGLGSLLGQRTVILTPIFSKNQIPHLLNLQRAVVGLATAHLEPGGLPLVFGGGGGGPGNPAATQLVPESTAVAICVIVAWLVGWTIIGAWRMATRDA